MSGKVKWSKGTELRCIWENRERARVGEWGATCLMIVL